MEPVGFVPRHSRKNYQKAGNVSRKAEQKFVSLPVFAIGIERKARNEALRMRTWSDSPVWSHSGSGCLGQGGMSPESPSWR